MTLEEFCEQNPQLALQRPILKQEHLEKTKKINFQKLHEKIHSSNFLMSRASLIWVINNYEKIIAGAYYDYSNSSVPQEKKQKPRQCEMGYGEALKHQREIAGFSQLELSKQLDIPQEVIDITEKGEKLSVIYYCVLLADFYRISLDELVGRNFSNEKKI